MQSADTAGNQRFVFRFQFKKADKNSDPPVGVRLDLLNLSFMLADHQQSERAERVSRASNVDKSNIRNIKLSSALDGK